MKMLSLSLLDFSSTIQLTVSFKTKQKTVNGLVNELVKIN